MVISPASINARLVAFTRVADRPSASCCSEAEGQTIGRPPLPQSCGWVKRNSQSTTCTRHCDRPSRDAAALKAASNCPGVVTPTGRPVKLSAVRSACSRPGVRRRKPLGVGAKLPPCALGAPLVSITISLSVDRDGQTSPVSGNRQFPLDDEASTDYVGGVEEPQT